MRSGFKLNRVGFSFAVFALALAVFLGLSATPAAAQSATGTVVGQITDQQGAIIAGADVRLVSTQTGSAFSAVSNEAGRYTFPSVPPGTYDLTVTKAGFTASKISNQAVDVGLTLTLSVALQVGATTTTVEVQAAAGADLQTLNSTVGSTITNEQLNLMPNLGRDASSLSVFQVGVTLAGNVAGAATDQNAYQLDGGYNSDDMAGNNSTYTPGNGYQGSSSTGGTPTGVIPTPIESIEEIKVGTTGQTADFNGAGGSQVQMVTKRGTNQFHGAAYEYYFGTSFGAANLWKNNHTLVNGPGCQTGAACDATPLPDTHRNRFGGALGGPITPKFWGGKTYFFVNYEGMQYPNAQTFERAVPTAAFRAGVIELPTASGSNAFYNINNGPVTVGGTTYQPAQCVTGGASGPCDPRGLGVNPVVQKIENTLPLPNDPTFSGGNATTGLVDGLNVQGYNGPVGLPQTSNFIVGRVDHDFGEKWKFMSSYRYYDYAQTVPVQTDLGGQLPGAVAGQYSAYGVRPQKPGFFVAGLTTNITANLTSDFRFSYLRNYWDWTDQAGPPQSKLVPGLGGALEIGGETSTGNLIPYNVDSQDVRQRFWDGHDYNFTESLSHLHGNHLFQYGGQYLRIFDYHERNDNGAGIDTSPAYWSSGSFLNNTAYTLPTGASSSALNNYEYLFNEATGIVNETQVLYTRAGTNLQLQPLGTPGFDQSILPTYEGYFNDTWHIKPSLTLSYGLGYSLSLPPYEINGKQVQAVDAAGNPIKIESYLQDRETAALAGSVYEPEIGFENIRNVGQNKYPYNPFYGAFSPHTSLAWNPNVTDGWVGKLLGGGNTVIRGGYARIYGRLNGVNLLLVPLLGPGLLQATSCVEPLMNGTCTVSGGATPANAFRIGADGLTAPIPTPTQTLPQPYFPGELQNGVQNVPAADGSTLDPNLRPNVSDEFTMSIQRSITPKLLVEVGYIGRLIHDEFQEINIDAIPWMTTLNGESFAQAYANVYTEMCGGNTSPQCNHGAAPNLGAVTVQPFFEAMLGGSGSAYCSGYSSCTAAVAANEQNNLKVTNAYQVWLDLAEKPSNILGRSLLGQPLPGQTQGQLSGSFDFINSLGHSNYNAGYLAVTSKDWHGLTARSNFTYGKSLGTGSVVQASSEITVPNPYNSNNFGTYGVQPFDFKYSYSLLMLYQPPMYRTQQGLIGHILGGWTIAPLFTARSGAPLRVSTSSDGLDFGEASDQTANFENAFGSSPFTGGNSYHYNVATAAGSSNPFGVATTGGSKATGVNIFANPAAIYNEFSRPVLGLDENSGGAGPIRGFGFWDLDATLSRNFRIHESINATFSVQAINLLNHFVPADPTLNIDSPSTFGVVTNQFATPNGSVSRSLEFGLRIGF
jgi:Carboxypeptidase regulatory-like domain